MFINYLNSVCIREINRDLENFDIVYFFIFEIVKKFCECFEGIFCWFNCIVNYVLLKVAELKVEKIILKVF